MSEEVSLSEMLSALLTEVAKTTEHPASHVLSEACLTLKVNVSQVSGGKERAGTAAASDGTARSAEIFVSPTADAATSGNLTVRLKLHFTPQTVSQTKQSAPEAEAELKASRTTDGKENGHA